jgi:hypothetical protein
MEKASTVQPTSFWDTKIGNFLTSEIVIFFISAIVVFASAYWFFSFISEQQTRVVESTDIGKAVESISIANGDRTQVRSTTGSYQVDGAFQLTFGNELVIEKRADHKTYLCDKKSKSCKTLAY